MWIKDRTTVRSRAVFTFDNIKARCRFSYHRQFPRYGGRGIELKVIQADFIDWYIRTAKGRMDLTIDRIDNDGHYEFGNMQLITKSENSKKAHRESKAMQKARLENAAKARKHLARCVRIGEKVYPSLVAASRSFGFAGGYVNDRIRWHDSTMPDGTPIEVLK